jgi:hypothetical protein
LLSNPGLSCSLAGIIGASAALQFVLLGGAFAFVRGPFALIGTALPYVRDPLALVSGALPHVRQPLALVRDPLARRQALRSLVELHSRTH